MKVEIGKRYRHKKGGLYEVVMIATYTETDEKLVIYTPVSEDGYTIKIKVWARPYDMFCDGRFVEHE